MGPAAATAGASAANLEASMNIMPTMAGLTPDPMSADIDPDAFTFDTSIGADATMNTESFPWEMIGLGLEEPLPPQDTIEDLYDYISRPHLNVLRHAKAKLLTDTEYILPRSIPLCL